MDLTDSDFGGYNSPNVNYLGPATLDDHLQPSFEGASSGADGYAISSHKSGKTARFEPESGGLAPALPASLVSETAPVAGVGGL
ncbi:MAG TPA: hypothetical protein VI365_21890 [Trebonia sp.]